MTKRRPGALAIQCVFAALVVATFAAFFATTRLKRSPPVVQELAVRRHFSPNVDGRLDVAPVRFRLRRSDDVTVLIVSRDGEQVATLADDVRLGKGGHRFVWNGRADDDRIAPDGVYYARVVLRHQGRVVTSPRKLFLDTTGPSSIVRYVSPDAITPGVPGAERARVRFTGPTRIAPTLLVYRTNERPGVRPLLVARRAGKRDDPNLSWDGRVGLGRDTRLAPAGNYLMVVRTRDAAGNDGPEGPPRTAAEVRGNPGVVVRYLAAVAPRDRVNAGGVARFAVLAAGRRYRWSVSRVGSSRPQKRGRSSDRTLRVGVPRRSRTGAYLLELTLDEHRYATPFAVQGRGREPVLVVLPVASWIARDPIDSDGDGYSDTLPQSDSVPASRPIAGSGLPGGFETSLVPALEFLDRAKLRYDIASDLDRRFARLLDRHPGVLYAASPRVETTTALGSLRSHMRAGGQLAWLGTGGFVTDARVEKDAFVRVPSPPGANSFGERLRIDPAGGPLSVGANRNGLFENVPSPFGPFASLELAQSVPKGAQRTAAAGPPDQGPAIVSYRMGAGGFTRVGAADFGQSLRADGGLPSSAQIMRNLWNLLRS
ncbi:MAG: N,N-dimethylformamidase beta subunit family domain-containing protein [Solirubrobacterales bacterium]